ncbi:hypothetical protein HA44_08340 [Mixta gaviniae]|nr:hypothetical protein HA44_08340 [Mixta gaviniae]
MGVYSAFPLVYLIYRVPGVFYGAFPDYKITEAVAPIFSDMVFILSEYTTDILRPFYRQT